VAVVLNRPIDYSAALAGDETLHDALAAIAASRTANLSQLNALHYNDLVRFGEIPANVGFDVPQQYRDLAAQATAAGFSTIGQLQDKYRDLQSGMVGRLGERGLIRSGDYGFQTNRLLRQQGVERANALDALMQGFNTERGSYLDTENQLNQQAAQANQDAWQRLIDKINAGLLNTNPQGTGGAGSANATATAGVRGSIASGVPSLQYGASDHPTPGLRIPQPNYLQTHSSDAGFRSTFTPLVPKVTAPTSIRPIPSPVTYLTHHAAPR